MEKIPLFVNILTKLFPYRFTFAKLTRIPGIGSIVDKMFFDKDRIYYLPLDKVVQIEKNIYQDDSIILPSKVVEHFIEKSNHQFIMNFCICRISKDCNNYPKDYGCLFLGEATLNIDPKLGKNVTKEEAKQYIKKCNEAGLVHLIGRNKLDSSWLKAKPADKLMTICNCCECCCLWMMLPNLSKAINSKVTKLPGLEINVTNRCVGCGECVRFCFVNAISVINGKAVINGECRGCGRCANNCKSKAIEIIIPSYSLEESIKNISSSVDVS
ncbi:MAG: hydrogenase MvhADGHdrABC F420-non-reducing hydrogenase subunit B [Candidatus Methanofastidiosum methylothiophilum]|jgi:ferredoxin|uniref:Hydrogenase MvhADGHdrABC F420-non-reducing hydrogenase subunit B n=1 Tax=Candidatus Methanofastidiosum methylothiophilum TaxID=1705564 RepID=A0A150J525_9EURY|nr:MAG: hydrogenase MvhADGHdrABC F420-non-reducing hydrogenase subunit B [Candidatus Methanofastidiosum methylthiophilus]NMC76364.1 4Fe-4S binding protein [Candidatus Methanofastidiosa archaeon]